MPSDNATGTSSNAPELSGSLHHNDRTTNYKVPHFQSDIKLKNWPLVKSGVFLYTYAREDEESNTVRFAQNADLTECLEEDCELCSVAGTRFAGSSLDEIHDHCERHFWVPKAVYQQQYVTAHRIEAIIPPGTQIQELFCDSRDNARESLVSQAQGLMQGYTDRDSFRTAVQALLLTDKNGDGVLDKEEMREECGDKVMRESRLRWEQTLASEQIDWLFDQIVVDPPMSWACTKKGDQRDQAAFHANGLVEIDFLLDTAKDWVHMWRAHVQPWHKNPYKYFRLGRHDKISSMSHWRARPAVQSEYYFSAGAKPELFAHSVYVSSRRFVASLRGYRPLIYELITPITDSKKQGSLQLLAARYADVQDASANDVMRGQVRDLLFNGLDQMTSTGKTVGWDELVLNGRGAEGETLLHLCALTGLTQIARYLLDIFGDLECVEVCRQCGPVLLSECTQEGCSVKWIDAQYTV